MRGARRHIIHDFVDSVMTSTAAGFLLGVVGLQYLPALPPPGLAWLLLVLLPLWVRFRRFRFPLALLCGFLWALVQAHERVSPALDRTLEGQDLQVQGVVASIPYQRGEAMRFVFDAKRLEADGVGPTRAPLRIRLNWYGHSPELTVGQKWQLTVRLKRPWGFKNPGGFDYERWLLQQGIQATGYVRSHHAEPVLLEDSPLSRPIGRLRQRLAEQIEAARPGDANRGVITALAVGERYAMAREQWAVLRNSGTNHLLAISGLHIGLVAGLAYFLTARAWRWSASLCRGWPARRAAAVAAIACGLGYAALAGFSVPTQRALIMLGVVMGAVLTDRSLRAGHALGIALLAVLAWDSLAVLSAGFWLSFAAVAVIVYRITARSGTDARRWRLGRLQLVLAIGLLPITLVLFQRFALIAPLANLFAVPWIGLLVVPVTLLGVLCLPAWPALGGALLSLASGSLEVFWAILTPLTDSPLTQWHHAPPEWTLIPALAGVMWLLAPRGWPARWLGLGLCLPLVAASQSRPEAGAFRFTLLDVGQGLSAVIETQTHSLVYDVGARFSESFNTGEAVVVPFLRARHIDVVDTLMITHADNDHSGGAQALADSVPIRRVLTSVAERFPQAHACQAGQKWTWDGVVFEVLHPPQGWQGSDNNRSCVLRVANASGSVLLTGDIESEAEALLTAQAGDKLASDVLLIPHHGSRTSSSREFIAAVDPSLAMVPVGYRNRFGFPKEDIIERYSAQGITVLNTVDEGAITVDVHAHRGIQCQPGYRHSSRRYWTTSP